MPKLIVTASSERHRSTARNDAVRISREDLRSMIHTGVLGGVKIQDGERMIKRMRNALISAALLDGRDVVVSEGSLTGQLVKELHVLALLHGARFIVAGREPKWRPETPLDRVEPYDPDTRLPDAVIVDIDGTVAKHVDRSPYDYGRVGTDAPKPEVIRIVRGLYTTGHRIIFVSGRPDHCREATELWLDEHVRDWHELHMRASGDTRNDAIVKLDIFDTEIRDKFHVRAVLDDRDRVVRMWRTLGLTVLQVADGAF